MGRGRVARGHQSAGRDWARAVLPGGDRLAAGAVARGGQLRLSVRGHRVRVDHVDGLAAARGLAEPGARRGDATDRWRRRPDRARRLMVPTEGPLCVDCDGTLIRTDLLHESALQLIKNNVSFFRGASIKPLLF